MTRVRTKCAETRAQRQAESLARSIINDRRIVECLDAAMLRAERCGKVLALYPRRGWRELDYPDKGGYLRGNVRPPGTTAYHTFRAHRVVAITFHGLPPDGRPYVNHINGLPADNRPENLEWVSPRGNHRHAVATGLINTADEAIPFWKGGSKHPGAILTEDDARAIAARFAAGDTHAILAEAYGVNGGTIDNITRGISWSKATGIKRRLGTPRVNHQRRGSDHHMVTLTDDQVREIHRKFDPASHGHRARLAREYNIGWTTVDYILAGKTWHHIYREFHP